MTGFGVGHLGGEVNVECAEGRARRWSWSCGGLLQVPMSGHPEYASGESKANEDVDEIVVAEVDGGEPEADAGNSVEAEAIFFLPAIEEEDVGGDGAVEAGENVDAGATDAEHGGAPAVKAPAGEWNVK